MSSWTALRSLAQAASVHVGNRCMIQQQQRLICSLTPVGSSLLVSRVPLLHQQRFAARKGTRERKVKQKVKAEIAKKEEFVPYKVKLAKLHVPEGPRRIVEKNKPEVVDDVFVTKHFMTRAISLADAVQFHRETNHPSVYDSPEALITMKVELNMQLEKKNRYLDNFSRILLLPHSFEYQPVRKVLAFCKTQETQEDATKAGANAVGGLDLVKRIQSGEVPLADYDYFVAHTNMMSEVLPLRGLLKRKLPNVKNGSVGVDMPKMIRLFSKGIEFASTKDAYELDYGLVQVPFGRLTMPMEELEANFSTILKDIESCRARTSGSFITRCYVLSPPSPEYFVVKTEAYIKKKAEDTSSSSSSDDDSDNEKADEEEEQNTSRARVAKQ
ncbi:large ribosomal subunit protein uL1m-like [Daphnia carinata]|uniref:large ribosomal subunit protein uL1m-like n=1 Tax=Daphnia carinata TaxID=120202 RepID=UPI00257F8DF1|nr:large ribosomal subunit protein uL1m-like [Daphnia carinata]